MKIIITEQQFNLILLGEGRVPHNKPSDEELKQKYDGYVETYNKLWDEERKIISSHIPNTNPRKKNPDFSWLQRNGKLDDFYKETFYYERKKLLKDKEYDRLVKKYNKLWDEKREIISSQIANTKPRKKNPEYGWLEKNKKLDDFYKETFYYKRKEELDEKKYSDIYGFNPYTAVVEDFIKYINEEGYTSWVEFRTDDSNLFQILIKRKMLEGVKNLLPKEFFKESLGERYIKEWLVSKKITGFKKQHTFCDLKDKKCLFMDFYSPNFNGYKVCIEFDGIQHFEGIKRYKNDTIKIVKERFNATRKRDRVKDRYCYNNGIILYRVKHNSKASVSKDVIDKIMGVIIKDIKSGQFNYEFFETGYLDTANFKIGKI